MSDVAGASDARARQVSALLGALGYGLSPGASVLDLGCGNGDLVWALRELGYDAGGCDFAFKEGPRVAPLQGRGHLRIIPGGAYRLPYGEATFDCAISDQVLEHVEDFTGFLGEVARVLKGNGASLHFFPARCSLMEVHRRVPLGGLIQKPRWIELWIRLLSGGHRAESAEAYAYLRDRTHYRSPGTIRRIARSRFSEVRFVEHEFLSYSLRGRALHAASRLLPFLPWLVRNFHSVVLLAARPVAASGPETPRRWAETLP